MNYEKQYNLLITKAVKRNLTKEQAKNQNIYVEKHHILPGCMGGTNEPHNLVCLTAREHFIAHYLLLKMHPKNRKIIYAASTMMWLKRDYQKRHRVTARQYEYFKKIFAQESRRRNLGRTWSSEINAKKGRSGKENAFYGRKHSKENVEYQRRLKKHKMKPVIANGTFYESRNEAARQIGVTRPTITNRINSNAFPEYDWYQSPSS